MAKIKKDPSVHALFFNTVDSVIRSKEEEFLIVGEVILEQFKGDDSVRYCFNSLGYRSDEFIKYHDGKHVLFTGCSETEGYGGNLDSSWSYMLYNELIKNNKLSGFFNLSRGGWGHETIIMNTLQYIQEYGKPDKIYMLLPELARKYEWQGSDKNNEHYSHRLKTTYWSKDDIKFASGKIRPRQTLEEQRSDIIRFTILLRMFEEYCISNNIELLWSCHAEPDAINYQSLYVFKNFIKMPDQAEVILKSKTHKLDTDKEKIKFRKRDWHYGYLYHYMWVQRFMGVE